MSDQVKQLRDKKMPRASKVYSCPQCNYKANRSYNLQRHMTNHYEKPPRELQHFCQTAGCTFATMRWDNLRRHMQRVHDEPKHRVEDQLELQPNNGDIEIEPVTEVAELAPSDEELASMFIDVIPVELEEEQPSPNTNLNTIPSSKETPQKVKKKIGRPRKKSGKTKYYECTTCEYRTNRGYNIKRHIAKHIANNGTELLLHVCVIAGCGFSTPRWDNLCRHVKRVHPESEKPPADNW
ncbi:zinc finger protein 333-like [Drosophila albomicans]|uniref:Zinc finger protein 333-like n=1 Tax=Drosophila albomicans TaxID=7291 RepID=A0A6P8WAD8_DROAB|nr:zinc finger protein 333-like [Drosophila albomicans]